MKRQYFTSSATGQMQAHGEIAKHLLNNGMDWRCLKPWIGRDGRAYMSKMTNNGKVVSVPVNNATLRRDEWQEIDRAVIEAARIRLVGVQSLYDKNLVKTVNGLSKTVLETETANEFTEASMSMDANVRGEKDRPNFETVYLPLPIIHKPFSFNIRTLNASRNNGESLDTVSAANSSMVISEKTESLLFQGSSNFAYGGGTIYGYEDYPYRNQVIMATPWTDSSMTGELIFADVTALKQASIDARHYGPFELYVPSGYETKLDEDYKAGSDKSIFDRLMEIKGIDSIKVIDQMTADTVILVQMTSNVVRMVDGMPLTTVEWPERGGMSIEYMVMSISVPQIMSDQNNRCGVSVLKQAS